MNARATSPPPAERVSRSRPARAPERGAWPAEMRADVAAAFLDYDTTGQLLAAIVRAEAPRPTATRLRKGGRREPVWALEALRAYVALRHEIADDASPHRENVAGLI